MALTIHALHMLGATCRADWLKVNKLCSYFAILGSFSMSLVSLLTCCKTSCMDTPK